MKAEGVPSVPWSDQVEAADWIVGALSDDLASVAWLVPRTFPAVARLLHPVEIRNDLRVVIPRSEVAQHDRQFIGTLAPRLEVLRVTFDDEIARGV